MHTALQACWVWLKLQWLIGYLYVVRLHSNDSSKVFASALLPSHPSTAHARV